MSFIAPKGGWDMPPLAVGILILCLPLKGWGQTQQPKIDYDAIHAAEAKANKELDEAAARAPEVHPPTREELNGKLIAKRNDALGQIGAYESMLNARSFDSKSTIFCRYQLERSLRGSVLRSVEYVAEEYRKEILVEPKTAQEEPWHQGRLKMFSDWLALSDGLFNECKGNLLYGNVDMAYDAEIREEIKKNKAIILEIDQQLRASSPQPPAAPARR